LDSQAGASTRRASPQPVDAGHLLARSNWKSQRLNWISDSLQCATDRCGPETDPDTRDLASFKPYVKKVKRYVRDHLPLLDHRKPAILETCMYTMTPDSYPIVDRLADNLVVGCGFSGSGFKHSPATGWMLAALALEQDSEQ